MDRVTAKNNPTFQFLVVIAAIVLVGTFYILTIREGQDWGGDFSLYVHHAIHIVEGKDYADTGYIVNPYNPSVSPQAYPPVFPLLLSPVYYWFGLNLEAMKAEIILLFSAFLLVFWLTIKDELPFPHQVAVIAILGFNPFFWEFKDEVRSDIPFLLFAYVGLLFIHRAKKANPSQKVPILYAIATGFIIYVAYGTRSIGAILLLSLLLYDLLASKRFTPFTIIVTVSATSMILLQNVLLPSTTGGYLSMFTTDLEGVVPRLIRYQASMSSLFANGYYHMIERILFAIVCGLALIGYLAKVTKNVTIYEIFMPMYICTVFIWPEYQGARFLIPIIPLIVLYAFISVSRGYFPRVERVILAVLILGMFGSYVGRYTTEDYGPIAEGIHKRETIELFDYIKANTEQNATFIFVKPRILNLFTDRRAVIFQFHESKESTIKYYREVGADYVVIKYSRPADPENLINFIKDNEEHFSLVYSNSDFKVYRILYDA